jgi:hypothetical protein
MTAKVVTRNGKRVVVRPRSYTPPKLPAKPSVVKYCTSYGRTKNGAYIVPRFYITDKYYRGYIEKQLERWVVVDMEEANIAEGTKKNGYSSKEQAKKIAEHYRDTYGAWSTVPF